MVLKNYLKVSSLLLLSLTISSCSSWPKLTQIEVQTEEQRLRPNKSEVERLYADNKKAKRLLGWQPSFSGIDGFEKGLSETVEWFMNKENLKAYKSERYNI